MITKEQCRVYLKSVQAGAIRQMFEVLKEIIHDGNLVFTPEGVRLATMDSAKCSLVYLRLRGEAFEEYQCATPTRVGMNMAATYKLVKSCGTHDTIILYVKEDAPNELGIHIENAEKNSRTDFSLKLLDVDGNDIKIPDIEFDSVVTLPSTMFLKVCRDMSNLSGSMTITSSGKTLALSCEGDFASQTTVIGETEDGLAMENACDDAITGTYSLKYLSLFCRASSLCTTTTLFIKREHPLVLLYHVAGLGELKFLLTPLIDE